MTASALAVVAFFAYQASGADEPAAGPATPPSDSASPSAEGDGSGGEAGEEPALPADSGEGRRVVYSLGQQRVWLVEESEDGTGEAVAGTFEVFPSSVSPEPGEYHVSSRTEQGTGSDGVPIEHSVVFDTNPEGVVFGFSAALDGSAPDPNAEQRTGGIRQTREDGSATWDFASEGTTVVVVS
ncbi:hypothetical protein D7294_00860 [Streptomyces hoynatensis]|uniref:L,D-transpeptidase n=1 Tax=Streptomyces hoynatensis TaxID=1141874 RepID=A0A3A9ZFT3_9ACTN|nr:hypothetical protein D7294_00860 [Streptomyces hoynatensis]